MAKRGVQEGSVYRRRDGRWCAVLHLGYENGRRNRKTHYTATRQEAAAWLAAAVRDLQQGKRPVPEQESVAVFLQRWLADVAKRTVRASTLERYERLVRLHLEPALGHIRLARLTAAHVDGFYADLIAKGLAPATIRLAHATLHRALKYAKRRGAVASNVADDVDPPSIPRKEVVTLSAAEAARFLEAARGDRFNALYHLALTTGLRQSELLGLRWSDIDFDRATLAVKQQCYRLNGSWVFIEPKTASGRRSVALSPSVVEALREHRARQIEERLRTPAWGSYDLVFCNNLGQPTEKSNLLRRSFWPLLEKAGLPHMKFHGLRHSAATLLLQANVNPKIVAEMLGHSSVALTLDCYSHVVGNMQEIAVGKVEALLAANS